MFLLYPSMYYVMLLTHIQWHVAPKIAPNNLCSWYLCPCVISTLNMGWNKWFTSKEQNIAKVMILELQEDCGFHLGCSILLSHLFDLQKCQLPCCKLPYEGPYGKELWEVSRQQTLRNRGPQSNCPQGIKFSQQSGKWVYKWIFPQSSLQMSLQPQPTLWL